MLGLAATSEALGYASIAAWLGAQFPQVIENYQRSSCEGLALPFLANWLLGDFSNLIGCILTHQLPFQTHLATYFVFIDCALLGQYIYYQWWLKPPQPIVGARRTSHIRATSVGGYGTRPRYRTLSAVASNVAAAAALAAQQEQVREHQSGSVLRHHHRNIGSARSLSSTREEEIDENVLDTLADSFHSEGGRNIGRKRFSWSVERRGGSIGRYLQRQATAHGSDLGTEQGDYQAPASSPPTIRHNSMTSRQGAGLAFLSVFAIFSLGNLVGSRNYPRHTGSVLVREPVSTSIVSAPSATHSHPAGSEIGFGSLIQDTSPTPYVTLEIPADTLNISSETDRERVIGRIFAWLCTTLYLTSRLPQIWKNFARKSVEGLSVYLFIFAFMGNFFYVLSILTNPKAHEGFPASVDFIKESTPYLLGSGGTFIFDITIVMQVAIYRKRPLKGVQRGRRRSRNAGEEESGLLAGDDSLERVPYTSTTPTS